MVKGESELFFIANAGRTIRYMLKVGPDGTSQGIYVAASEDKALVETSNGARTPNILESRTEFVGGATLGIAEVSLVEKKMEERRAIKPGREQDAENAVQTTTGAGTSEAMAVLKVMEIDKLRMATGGVEQIDASKYKVTVRRPFAPTLPAWTGEFTGRVQFFSVDNLLLITAGTKLVALDAKNAKQWESTLGAPAVLGDHQQWESAPSRPGFEDHGRLYFFDRAVLTAFNASNGEVVWRLPSIGIQKVEATADGSLFVHSANLPAESLTYLSESSAGNQPVLMRVNPKDGSVQWSVEKFENVWAAGKDVYSMRIGRHSSDVEKAVFQPGTPVESRMKIYKLNTRNGKPRWEWFQSRTAESVIPFGKTIALLFSDELQIVHSTAL
jgi:outer membrane protein assembly factor BamB